MAEDLMALSHQSIPWSAVLQGWDEGEDKEAPSCPLSHAISQDSQGRPLAVKFCAFSSPIVTPALCPVGPMCLDPMFAHSGQLSKALLHPIP